MGTSYNNGYRCKTETQNYKTLINILRHSCMVLCPLVWFHTCWVESVVKTPTGRAFSQTTEYASNYI